jgi:hypothetical protein
MTAMILAVLLLVVPYLAWAQTYTFKAIKKAGAFDTFTVGLNDFGSVIGHWQSRDGTYVG